MSNHESKPATTSRSVSPSIKSVGIVGKTAAGSQAVASNASAAPPTLAAPVTPMGSTAAGSLAQATSGSAKPLAADARVPGTWDAIKPGSLVLATTGPTEGWFESLIVATRADDRFLLRWRDWPEEPEFTRRRDELALLHPATDPQG